jgi:hypothetical protein
VVTGTLVEAADQLPGRGQHDRIEALVAIGLPGVEDAIEGGGGVADVDALPIEVEAECFRSAVAERQGGGGLGGICEAVQLGQADRAMTISILRRTPPAPIAASC